MRIRPWTAWPCSVRAIYSFMTMLKNAATRRRPIYSLYVTRVCAFFVVTVIYRYRVSRAATHFNVYFAPLRPSASARPSPICTVYFGYCWLSPIRECTSISIVLKNPVDLSVLYYLYTITQVQTMTFYKADYNIICRLSCHGLNKM